MFELACKLADEGRRIYHFEVGEPDFQTPSNIVDAGIKALREGKTKYASSRGAPPLLDAIEEMYSNRGIDIDGRKNVIVTPGAKMALYSAIVSTIDPGDEVLLLSPAWPTYRVMIQAVGAKPVDVPVNPDFTLNEEALKKAMTRTVTGLILNSPCNPSGGVMTKDELKTIYDLAEDNDFVVFSDEIYEALVYNDSGQTSALEIDPTMSQTLLINGFSKAYAMTGWRLGFAIGNSEAIGNMIRIQQNTTSCAASFVQMAGVEALTGDQSSIDAMVNDYKTRRDEITNLLNQMEGVSCVLPKGAFYVFPDFADYGLSSNTLAELILKKTGVTTTPGAVFGDAFSSNLRFSYAASMEEIKEGLFTLASYLPNIL
jgi:aspartate/methionine/tyrosine aminotransferase